MPMKTEQVLIAELTYDPNNARKHSQSNLDAISGSLQKFGQRKPIVVTPGGVIVAGNGTVEAALMLGWKDVAVVRVPEDWDENQIKAFALADNKTAELAEWDPSVLMEQGGELMAGGFKLEEFGFTDADLGIFDVQEVAAPTLEAGGKGDIEQITFTLHSEQANLIRAAIAKAKLNENISAELNDNSNGNALAFICEWYSDGRV